MTPSLRRGALTLALTFTLAAFASQAHAAPDEIRKPGKFGIGLGSGTLANGLSAKWYMADLHALQFTLGAFGGAASTTAGNGWPASPSAWTT